MSQRTDSGEDPPPSGVPGTSEPRVFVLSADDRDFLMAMATRLCRSSSDPGDLVQDVLERAIRHAAVIPSEDPRPWLIRVMRNLFIDRLRKQNRTPRHDAIDDQVVSAAPAAERAWWQELEPADIRAKLVELPDELRTTFELFAFDGLPYDEIARRQQISRNTVGTRILRARRRLRALFEGGERGE